MPHWRRLNTEYSTHHLSHFGQYCHIYVRESVFPLQGECLREGFFFSEKLPWGEARKDGGCYTEAIVFCILVLIGSIQRACAREKQMCFQQHAVFVSLVIKTVQLIHPSIHPLVSICPLSILCIPSGLNPSLRQPIHLSVLGLVGCRSMKQVCHTVATLSITVCVHARVCMYV